MSRRASLPLAASPTISTPERAASSSRSTSRATGSSSTIRVRSGEGGIIKELAQKPAVPHGKVMIGGNPAPAGLSSATGGPASVEPILILLYARPATIIGRLRGRRRD